MFGLLESALAIVGRVTGWLLDRSSRKQNEKPIDLSSEIDTVNERRTAAEQAEWDIVHGTTKAPSHPPSDAPTKKA